jgi:hypothetical protein
MLASKKSAHQYKSMSINANLARALFALEALAKA